MVCFIIALRSKQTTKNWDNVVKDFNNTLRSMLNQTDGEFRIFVACSEIPPLESCDNRIQFIPVDFPIPTKWSEYTRDRALKLMACTIEIKKNFSQYQQADGGVFVFPVDADDLISNKVVEFIHAHPDAHGFKSKKGYVWSKGKKYAVISPYYGGSCNIMKLYYNELADSLPEKDQFFLPETGRYLIENFKVCWDDHEVIHKFAASGRHFTTIPFPSTMYLLGTGENISVLDERFSPKPGRFAALTGIQVNPISFLRKINPFDKRLLTRKRMQEFSIRAKE